MFIGTAVRRSDSRNHRFLSLQRAISVRMTVKRAFRLCIIFLNRPGVFMIPVQEKRPARFPGIGLHYPLSGTLSI
ncbi:hypothetical protein JW948_08985 [bacterium]|nr:hypothetical protein [bacterium]